MTIVHTLAVSTPFTMNQETSSGSCQSPTDTHGSDSGSQQSKPQSKRASRAGTRSVSTLSAAQLERKRANDREAQRAIRQRTKDHIESLERRISEISGAHEAREKLYLITEQRNRELEDENIYLRNRLSGAPFALNVNQNEEKPPQYSVSASDSAPNSSHLAAGINIARPASSSTTRSIPQQSEAWKQYSPGHAPNSMSFVQDAAAQHATAQQSASWRAQDASSGSNAYTYSVRPGDRSASYSSTHQGAYPGHAQPPQFQQGVTSQTPTQSTLPPNFHNTGVAAHQEFQNMPQYNTQNSGYQDQQSHGTFVGAHSGVSSAESDFQASQRSLAPPTYNTNVPASHFMSGQQTQSHNPQQMAYRENAVQHTYSYDA